MTFIDQLKKLDSGATPAKWVSPWDNDDKHADCPAFRTEDGKDIISAVYYDGEHICVSKTDAAIVCLLRNNTQAIIELVEAVEKHQKERMEAALLAQYWHKSPAEMSIDEALAKLKGRTRDRRNKARKCPGKLRMGLGDIKSKIKGGCVSYCAICTCNSCKCDVGEAMEDIKSKVQSNKEAVKKFYTEQKQIEILKARNEKLVAALKEIASVREVMDYAQYGTDNFCVETAENALKEYDAVRGVE